MPEQDLDDRIRQLVARAVADAPPAPDLDPVVVRLDRRRPDHRRARWVGGGAALLAVAAAITTVVLINDTDERISTPATVPAPTMSATPDTPATVDAPGAASTTTEPGTTLPPATRWEATEAVLTAGADGVTAYLDGRTTTLWTEPVRIALATPGGRVILTPDDEGGGAPLVLDPSTGAATPLLADHPEYWTGLVLLHDVELVDGRELLLYGLIEGTDQPAADTERIYLVDLATGDRQLLAAPEGAPDASTATQLLPGAASVRSRLSMSVAGDIVGTLNDGNGVSFLWLAVPGSPAAQRPRTAAELGLQRTYPGCDTECPRLFTISPDGGTIAWVEGADDAELVVHEDSAPQRIPLGFPPQETSLDIAPDGAFLLARAPAPVQAVRVARDGTVSELRGVVATAGPGGQATNPVAPPPTAAVVTAGPDGIAVLDEDGNELRRLDEPAAEAYLTPGGAVIFQAPRTEPGGDVGPPMIWQPDGAVERLLPDPAPGQSYRIYDVAGVDGVPTVLYGLRSRPTDGNPAGFREQLVALAMDPAGWTTTELAEIPTWEAGYTGLGLGADGTVIGTYSESVTTSYVAMALPGSPAEQTGVPDHTTLGIEPDYGDCTTCPNHFTVSADAGTIAWLADGDVVVFDVASATTERFALPDLGGIPVRLDIRPVGDGSSEVLVDRWSDDAEELDAVRFRLSPDGAVELPLGAAFASFAP